MCKIHQSELRELTAALRRHNESRVKIRNGHRTFRADQQGVVRA